MRKTEIIFGSVILGFGFLFLLGAFFDINIWGMICPAALIGLGIWLIYRTRQNPREGDLKIKFVGDIRREGIWHPESEETWGFVLELKLDFTSAELPFGEIEYRLGAFVNDIKVIIPSEVGIAIYSMAFFTESFILNQKQDTFFIPFYWESENYKTAAKKIIIKPTCFVSEIKIEHLGIDAKL